VKTPIVVLLLLAAVVSACGRKGPPLPPLVRTPVAPVDFAAERRAGHVDVSFTVPAANTDGTRPANIQRVDVYALTSPTPVPVEQLVTLGTAIARIQVKSPRDVGDVIGPDDSVDDLEPLVGAGLEQGVRASIGEDITPLARDGATDKALRFYVGLSVTKNGRRGLLSKMVAVPLTAAPPAPAAPKLTYDETNITLSWPPAATPGVAYHVYELNTKKPDGTKPEPSAAAKGEPQDEELRLTSAPVDMPQYMDASVEWGVERCYRLRAVEVAEALVLESEPGPSACVTPRDTFPPAPPVALETGPSEGAISLVWDAGKEKDVAGYIVLRGIPSAATLAPITPTPIQETAFTDKVPSGTTYAYAVQAVDKSGNISAPSARKEETAR